MLGEFLVAGCQRGETTALCSIPRGFGADPTCPLSPIVAVVGLCRVNGRFVVDHNNTT